MQQISQMLNPKPPKRKTKTFESIGRCIYCGDDKSRLTDEHIVPFSLGGGLVFKKSSCEKSAKITRGITESVARSMYGRLRVRLNAPTRRPKARPKTFSVLAVKDDGSSRIVHIPAELYPRAYSVLEFSSEAGILVGTTPTTAKRVNKHHSEDMVELVNRGYLSKDEMFGIEQTFSVNAFCRQLAQIGHAHTAALIGIDGYEQVLPPLILGASVDYLRFMGCVPPNKELRSSITFDVLERGGKYYVACRFAITEIGWQFPTYQIICGVISSKTNLDLILSRIALVAKQTQPG